MKRICQIIRVKPERFEEYCKVRVSYFRNRSTWLTVTPPCNEQVHAEVWPSVLTAMQKVNNLNEKLPCMTTS